KVLADAQSAAQQCAALTEQLLAIGRRQHLRPERINLNELIASEEALLRSMIGQGIEFVQDLDPSLGFVYADPVQLRRILANLTTNARDAMPGGGRLRIATATVDFGPRSTVVAAEIRPGRYVRLTVTDTGIGLSEEVKQHMFDPFFTTKPAGKGSGLGLSTVYGIVTQSGGHVSVRSESGTGTTVDILLPVREG